MKRLLPLFAAVAALGIAAIVTAVAVGASSAGSDKSANRQNEDSSDGSGVAAMCAEGHPDCNDMIVEGEGDAVRCTEEAADCVDTSDGGMNMCIAPADPIDAALECNDIIIDGPNSGEDIDPGECSLVHNIDACSPEDIARINGGGTAYDITIPFDASVNEEDTKLVMEIVMAFDANADVLLLESFPPTGRATLTSSDLDVCAAIESKLEGVPSVGDVTCAVAAAAPPVSEPDEPVSSEPDYASADVGSPE